MLVLVFAAGACAANCSAQEQGKKQASIASLVRTLGYGGAIHHFKDYVLRGDEKYGVAAKAMFRRANTHLAELGKASLTADEKRAIDALRDVVAKYEANIPVVQRLHQQKESVEVIDESVAVDDSRAIRALGTLREGQSWKVLDDLDYHVGYGSGIHNFKDFVLRADEKYRAQSMAGLSKVLLIVTRYRSTPGLDKDQMAALDSIEKVVRTYETSLTKVQSLVGEGKNAQEIDKAVRVDDDPAFKGLSTLRK
jgi:methyl-accepting chemotaxis protein